MARKQEISVVDFETKAIEDRPRYPPVPCGVAMQRPGEVEEYAAWGHPTGNGIWVVKKVGRKAQMVQVKKGTDPKRYAKLKVRDIYAHDTVGHHNDKFDLDVAETHLGAKIPAFDRRHCTMLELFFMNPHSRTLSLKPASEKVLGLKPEEQEEVRDWLLAHGKTKNTKKDPWGAHIAEAPGDLVGKYAIGDIRRTKLLHEHIYEKFILSDVSGGMLRSYNRERQLTPILLENERRGMRINVRKLGRDIARFERAQKVADEWLRKKLKAPGLNVSSNEELADALDGAGLIKQWTYTEPTERHPEGQRSTSKKNMTVEMFTDAKTKRAADGSKYLHSPVYSTIGYRNRLDTCLATFMRPWLEMAEANNGIIHTTWNQVRQAHGDDGLGGSRTSRMSSYPNFLNVPKDWYDKNDGYSHPLHLDVPELPMMREYILPDEDDEQIIHVDYSQQEYRLIGHFEDGSLCARYNANPFMDFHREVGAMITDVSGRELQRRILKIVNFLDAYGGGIGKLALMAKISYNEAKEIKRLKRQALPDVAEMDAQIKHLARTGQPIRTWGGSLIHCEPPALIKFKVNGKDVEKWQTFEYKMLNYLIQRSAAEMTKQSIINYHHHPKRRGRWMVAVHDENNASAKKKLVKQEARVLVECMMNMPGCDVPMVTGDFDTKTKKHYPADVGNDWGSLKPLHFTVMKKNNEGVYEASYES